MLLNKIIVTMTAMLWVGIGSLEAETLKSGLGYTYPVERLKWGPFSGEP